MAIIPLVRYMILCEDWEINRDNPNLVNIIGLLSNIRSLEEPFYPLYYQEICVFIVLTGGRGQGKSEIRCVFEETDQIIFRTPRRVMHFPNDPIELVGVSFRIQDCPFPCSGLYSLQFWYEGQKVSDYPLRLR